MRASFTSLPGRWMMFLAISFFFSFVFISAQTSYDNYYSTGSNYNPYAQYPSSYTQYPSYTTTNPYQQNPSSSPYYNTPYYNPTQGNFFPPVNQQYPDYYNRYNNGPNVYGSSVNPQFYPPSYSGFSSFSYTDPSIYWSNYGTAQCVAGQDLILQIAPGGCSPKVVRSDLLEEQNVPVFCKVMAIQVNPLIDISRINSIRIKGQYPKGVASVSYYPARAAIGGKKVFDNSIVDDNLGYVVIVLSRQAREEDMPEYVEGNISAVVNYVSEASFGIGEPSFYLTEMSDEKWVNEYRDYGFWNGKGYLRVDSINQGIATLSVYRDVDTRISTINLREGQTSSDIFLTGFYCAAGLRLNVERIMQPTDSALLQIDGVSHWVAKGDRILDNRCRIVDLQTYPVGGKVSIQCPGKPIVVLSLSSGGATFSTSETMGFERAVGTLVANNVYLAHIGQTKDNKRYVVLIKDPLSDSDASFSQKGVINVVSASAVNSSDVDSLRKKIETSVKNHYTRMGVKENIAVGVISERESFEGITLNDVKILQDSVYDYRLLTEQQRLSQDYYKTATSEYTTVADLYPNEKMEYVEEDPYAAKSLFDAAFLSKELGMNARAHEYYARLVSEYPHSNLASTAVFDNTHLLMYDTSKSQASVTVGNDYYFVTLADVKRPDKNSLNAVFLIDGSEKTLSLRERHSFNKGGYVHSIYINGIYNDYVDIEYERTGGELKIPEVRRQRVRQTDNQIQFNGVNVKLIQIHSDEQVKVRIVSQGTGPQIESPFMFRIGIEKRAIRLSPDQAQDMMNSLKKSITEWDSINQKLGTVISGLKAACFATAAVLTTKNTISGYSGNSLGRNLLMTNSGGWNDKCTELVNKKTYKSIQECLLAHNDQIEKDVTLYGSTIKNTNTIIEGIKNSAPRKEGIFGNEIDHKHVEGEFKKVFVEWCKSKNEKITLPSQGTVILGNAPESICNWDTLTYEQQRDIMTIHNAGHAGGSDTLNEMTRRDLSRVLIESKNRNQEHTDLITSDKETNIHNLGVQTTQPIGDSVTQGFIKTVTSSDLTHPVYKNFKEGDRLVRVFIPKETLLKGVSLFKMDPAVVSEIGGKQVLIEMTYSEGDKYYYPKENGRVYKADGSLVSPQATQEVHRYMTVAGLNKIRPADKKAYQNKMVHPENLRITYFERVPYKGLPAEIPFDVENGWYVETTYVLSGFGVPYDESGKVVNYYICNVGENGLIEFKKNADDICRYYNAINPDVSFPGLTREESRTLVDKAKRAILDATRQYGKSTITINGKTFNAGTSFGGDEGQCTDFMSARDCSLLFNVCDPVICPASRCDFGGKYRVDNVIQSGIAGSLLLCLPNFREGVAVPICLTGIHAGLDNYMSILNSTVDCLNESIATGRNIGICDEIKSVYLCDFFWKQALPLTQVVVPSLFEGLSGQGRGGGEYLTVQNAWENTQGAVNYFAQVYAVNSLKAFSSRNVLAAGTEIGTDICKSFASLNFGSAGTFFESLIQPDSPVQYSGWFSEDSLTTATVPPTSHYKVYYHIYAGKDIGAYYLVYLKDIPQSSGVFTTGTQIVDRGYINRGSQVDQARDFIGASGFKQLCINVNGQDNCGFGKVSSSYALNALSESYVADQIQTGITSEKECVAGTPSLGSLLTPNIQSGVEGVLNPQLYNQGIVRVCATDNPGKQVLPTGKYDRTNSSYDRWKSVGYCDDPTIRCWLDTQSVKQVIRDKGIEQSLLQGVTTEYVESINYWTPQKSRSIADEAESFISTFELRSTDTRENIEQRIQLVVRDLRSLSQLGTTNIYRARAHYLLGKLYKVISEELWLGKSDDRGNIIYDTRQVAEEPAVVPDNHGGTVASPSNQPEGSIPPTTTSPSPSDVSSTTVFKLNSNNRIVNKEGVSLGYFVIDTLGSNDEKYYTIYQDKGYFGNFFTSPLGKIRNNFVSFDIESSEWTPEMKQLNGLHFDENAKTFYPA